MMPQAFTAVATAFGRWFVGELERFGTPLSGLVPEPPLCLRDEDGGGDTMLSVPGTHFRRRFGRVASVARSTRQHSLIGPSGQREGR